jgi:hypothetical protein
VRRPRLIAEGADDLIDAGRNELVLRLGSGERDRCLLIQNYTPAQHHNLMERPFDARVADGAAYGCEGPVAVGQGVSQNKAHQAVMLAALQLDQRMRISLGNRGRVDVDVTLRGRTTHSSTPEAGANAIEATALVVARLTIDRRLLPGDDPDAGGP